MVVSGGHMAVGHRLPSSVSLTAGDNAPRSLVFRDYTVSDMLLNQKRMSVNNKDTTLVMNEQKNIAFEGIRTPAGKAHEKTLR